MIQMQNAADVTRPAWTTWTVTGLDWLLLALLVALVLPLRLWLLHNTEVTARDSIGYIRYARDFDIVRNGLPETSPGTVPIPDHQIPKKWQDVLNKHHQHPGYSFLVWLMSIPVREHDGAMTPENMAYSAQLVNFFASLVLIVPMYFAGRPYFDRLICFLAALLYQYLPTSAQHLSDGISEPIFLVFLCTASLFAAEAMRQRRPLEFILCGLFTGLAYLTRPEGALVLPAACMVLAVMQLLPAYRCEWPRFFKCGGALIVTTAAVGSIYVYATGTISRKPTVHAIGQQKFLTQSKSTPQGPRVLFASTFPETENRGLRLVRSVRALATEIVHGFHYTASLAMLLGGIWAFPRLRHDPGFWAMATFGGILVLVLVALGMSTHYVSDRHVMIIVLGWSYFAIYGMQEMPRWFFRLLKIETTEQLLSSRWAWARSVNFWFAVLLLSFLAYCLPKSAHRLHANRLGNHEAGHWLAQHLKVGDHVEDDHNWSEYHSGFTFKEYEVPVLPADYVPTTYVVVTRSRDPEITARRHADANTHQAKVVFTWPPDSELEKARVVVFAQPRDFTRNPWHKSKAQGAP